MFSFIKKAFGKKREEEATAAEQATEAAPVAPDESTGEAPAPFRGKYAAPGPNVPAAPIQRRPQGQSNGDGVGISLQSVIASLPLELRNRVRQPDVGDATVSIPVEKVLSQLSSGSVKIPFGELRRAAPQAFSTTADCDQVQVSLPLQEILARIDPAMLVRRQDQRLVEVPDEVSSPFGDKGQGLNFTVTPAKAPTPAAGRAPAPARSQPAPAPISPKAAPAPVQPKPMQPAPIQPAQADSIPDVFQRAPATARNQPAPAPIQPKPVQPAPIQPGPIESIPDVFQRTPATARSQPAPAPIQPKPVQPVPIQPAPNQPSPIPFQRTPPPAQRPAAPAQRTPAQPGPVSRPPFQAAPIQPAPAQPGPAESIPDVFQRAPATARSQPAPAPIQPKPAQPAPVQPTPIQRQPAQPTPAPIQPATGRGSITSAPTPQPPAAAPIPSSPAIQASAALRGLSASLTPAAPPPARPGLTRQTIPNPAEPSGDGANVVVPLAALAESWPESLRLEIVQMNLVEAKLILPAATIEDALKRGKIAFPWKVLRSWVHPPLAGNASPHDNIVLELPLKVITPIFLARQKEAHKPQQKVAVDENIPNLFFGFPGGDGNAAGAAPASAAPASHAAATPGQMPSKVVDTNYYVWDDASDSAQADESETAFKRKPSPETSFITRYATPNEVVSRASALDGVAGALIALPDGLMVASRLAQDLNGDTLAAFLPHIFGKVSQCTKELRMGELNNLNFTVGNVPWKIFRVNAIFFAAFGRVGQPLPTAQLAALAAELDHKKQ